ncbi:hypothetical protein [Rhodanobacter fulvus]|uniref:hypothetical protein n=1 Tax=Rhodanobacter fulvus TaxID=219571 RepID=UPI0012EA442C|nr:hypothetical protein [Rhodanobacter fulvus]
MLRGILERASASEGQSTASSGEGGSLFPVRYRQRLVAELKLDAATARGLMRALLDACRGSDESTQIACLQDFADGFRRTALIKSVQFYPYLRCALEHDTMAMMHFNEVQTEAQRHVLRIEAILVEYLGAPWDATCRRRFVPDVARAASLLGRLLRQEESTLFPLYLPPDQYRYLAGPVARENGGRAG